MGNDDSVDWADRAAEIEARFFEKMKGAKVWIDRSENPLELESNADLESLEAEK